MFLRPVALAMRITDITAHALSSPIEPPDERTFAGGTRRILKRDVVLVVVETADGCRGIGPAGASSSAMREYFEGATHEAFVEAVTEDVAPLLEGERFDEIGDVAAAIDAATLPEYVRSQAAAAIDVALYDIRGQRVGAPVYELLRADADDDLTADGPDLTLPLYASAGMYMEPEGYARQAEALRDRGFVGYKYRPGGGPETDRRTLALLADTVGDEMALMIDSHTWWKLGERSYDIEQVVALLREFEQYDPYWVEEPVPPGDHGAYEAVAAETSIPLAGGESEDSVDGLKALADSGAVSFLQGDVRHHGGYTGCWEAAMHCVGRDVTYVPHNFGTHLGLVANAHVVAAAPETELLEYPVFGDDTAGMYPFPLADEILETDLEIEDGLLTVPRGPGLGVDVDFDVLDSYPSVSGPWTEFEYDLE